jgi:hypothetical protein
MAINLKTTPTTQFPVFILLIAPDNTPVTSKDAEVAMLELLKEADAPDIKVIHGVCVCGSQAAFYQYDRERQVVSPEPQGQVHFDLDLATESGARRFVEVAEHVEQMCRELVPDLEIQQPPKTFVAAVRTAVESRKVLHPLLRKKTAAMTKRTTAVVEMKCYHDSHVVVGMVHVVMGSPPRGHAAIVEMTRTLAK